jgi:hypothetical protein
VELWPKDDETKRQWCVSRGIVPEYHCCVDMAFAISEPSLTPHQGPNRIIDWIASWNEYRIPVPHDGYASTLIQHCPWCGTRLPPSEQDRWYRVLWDMGIADPGGEDKVPAEFDSDEWWRQGRA